jgi:energy-coupling factor transport system ATP-binding protein
MIRVENLSYSLKSRNIVEGISFTVDTGDRVLLSGGIGSGKTTIFKVISGIASAFYTGTISGEVEVFGKRRFEDFINFIYPVLQYPDEQIVFESVLDEIRSVTRVDTDVANLSLPELGLLETSPTTPPRKSLRKSLRVPKKISKKTDQLSDGQKQFLIILLALLSGRECICLDEPFSHLHPSMSRELIKAIMESGRTVIFSDKREYFEREFGKYFDDKIDIGGWKFEDTNLYPSEKTDEYAVIVEDLFFSYHPDQDLLSGINFELRRGEIVSIIGENGCGKTTFLKIISSILRGEGHLEVNGKVALSLQYPNYSFVERRVKDELRSLRMNSKKSEALSVLERLNVLDKHPHALSAGESKLVSIVKSFSGDILLLDEPMVGQEEAFRAHLINWLRKSKKSAIISTHDFELASMCDRVFELKNGKLRRIREVLE